MGCGTSSHRDSVISHPNDRPGRRVTFIDDQEAMSVVPAGGPVNRDRASQNLQNSPRRSILVRVCPFFRLGKPKPLCSHFFFFQKSDASAEVLSPPNDEDKMKFSTLSSQDPHKSIQGKDNEDAHHVPYKTEVGHLHSNSSDTSPLSPKSEKSDTPDNQDAQDPLEASAMTDGDISQITC